MEDVAGFAGVLNNLADTGLAGKQDDLQQRPSLGKRNRQLDSINVRH